jgi:hypothetical protein
MDQAPHFSDLRNTLKLAKLPADGYPNLAAKSARAGPPRAASNLPAAECCSLGHGTQAPG